MSILSGWGGAGLEVERLDKPQATEKELCGAVKGKVGYILGGTEHITQKIIDAADQLKVIAVTGIDYKYFVPAWHYATQKGIAIVNTPDGPTHAVAEWAVTMALAMNRGILELGRAGTKDFLTTKGLENQTVGIIGLGRIGQHIVGMLQAFRPKEINYSSLHRHEEAEKTLGVTYKTMQEVLAKSDVIFLCVPSDTSQNFIGCSELSKMKDGSLLVSFTHGIVDETALLGELKSGRIRVASDNPPTELLSPDFADLPFSTWYCFNGSNAFNTELELKTTSDMTTQSIINMLTTGQDQYRVN